MRLAYNTNGFPQHELSDVARLLGELGYDGIAITPDVFHLDPFRDGPRQARELAPLLRDLGLAVAVETGARFLLDRRRKHQPTLLSSPEGAAWRLEGLKRCLDLAEMLGAETFSLWSGTWDTEREGDPPPLDRQLDRLCAGVTALLDQAGDSSVRICFEPEPGMAVASLAELAAFLERLGRDELAIMLDVGHVPVTEELSPAEVIRHLAPRLGGVQLDDSRNGVHEHLFPGEGEIDFGAIVGALHEVGFTGLAAFELPRHGHDPVSTARRALQALDALGART